VLELLRREPGQLMLAAGMTPDPWQQRVLESQADRMLFLASRQCFDADTVVLDRQGRARRIRHHPDAWPDELAPAWIGRHVSELPASLPRCKVDSGFNPRDVV
jgi:hypothetical protein